MYRKILCSTTFFSDSVYQSCTINCICKNICKKVKGKLFFQMNIYATHVYTLYLFFSENMKDIITSYTLKKWNYESCKKSITFCPVFVSSVLFHFALSFDISIQTNKIMLELLICQIFWKKTVDIFDIVYKVIRKHYLNVCTIKSKLFFLRYQIHFLYIELEIVKLCFVI